MNEFVDRAFSPESAQLWLGTALSSIRYCIQQGGQCHVVKLNGFSKLLQVYRDPEMLDGGGGEDVGVS